MERFRRAWTALRENRRRGVALLIALCACALLLGLTLSLIYTASVPAARANRRLEQERCRLLADSFFDVLDAELRKYTSGEEGSFYNQVNAVLEDCGETGAAVLSFQLDGGGPDAPYGDLEIRLHPADLTDTGMKLRPAFREDITAAHDTRFNSYGSFDYRDAAEGTRTAELDNRFIRYWVKVDVLSSVGREQLLRSDEYYREDRYQPYYTWHITNLDSRPDDFSLYRPMEGSQTLPIDGVPVFWDAASGKFFRDAEKTAVIEPAVWYWDEPDGTRHTWTEEAAVSYVYYDKNDDFEAVDMHFIPAYERDKADRCGQDSEGAL